MRVTCKTNQQGERTLELTIGQAYLVVEVVINAGTTRRDESLMFRLSGDDEEVPALYESDWFDVVDPSLPSNWAFNQEDVDGCYVLGPQSFAQPGFWELYFDQDLEARATFAKEVGLMTQA